MSSFAHTPERVGPDHLAELLRHVGNIVPDDAVRNTPVFLLATAGMRLLGNPEQQLLLDQICSYVRSNSDFLLPDCGAHIQVISGVTEGLYGWIATNYLMNSFDAPLNHSHGKGHHTYGFLDMGGASTQIAFEPNATEARKHADDLKLIRLRNIDGSPQEHKIFVTSWLEFGVNEARRRFVNSLQIASGTEGTRELPDPCLPAGLRTTLDGKAVLPVESESGTYLLGTGRFGECLRQTYTLLDKDAPCPVEPCLLHGVHVPGIDFDVNHFIGISEFWHTTHEIFNMGHKDTAYDFHTYQHRVESFCSQDWKTIEDGILRHKWGKKVSRESAYEVCFKASWIINMLHEGIGVPRVGLEEAANAHNGTKLTPAHGTHNGQVDAFQAVNKIDATEVSWTLGKMVLYASSQVPTDNSNALPVGFGSNLPGVPDDFQVPSVEIVPDSPEESTRQQLENALFREHSPRRIPGFILFLFIVIVAAFFLCGRTRRLRLYHRIRSLFPRPGSSHPSYPKRRRYFGGKLPFAGQTKPSYERVMEDGIPDFELATPNRYGSEPGSGRSSGDSRSALPMRRESSWAGNTPSMKFDMDNSPTGNFGLGISNFGPAMDREGLAVRTESRNHLAPVTLGPSTNGRRSRAGSPTRSHNKSPIMTPLETD